VSALGSGTLDLSTDGGDCCVRAVFSGDSFKEAMITAASNVDNIDIVLASADGTFESDMSEVDGAEAIRSPIVTSLKGNFGNSGSVTEYMNFIFSVMSLSSQIVPFTRNSGITDKNIVLSERNIAGGGSLKYMLLNARCWDSGKPYSFLLERTKIDERGRIGRDVRNQVYSL
jgi:hypothetical protein